MIRRFVGALEPMTAAIALVTIEETPSCATGKT
jgi:hypothetical protein